MPGTKQTHLVQSIHAWDKAYTLDWDKANTPGAKQTHLGLGQSKHTWDWYKANTPGTGTKQTHLVQSKHIWDWKRAYTPGIKQTHLGKSIHATQNEPRDKYKPKESGELPSSASSLSASLQPSFSACSFSSSADIART